MSPRLKPARQPRQIHAARLIICRMNIYEFFSTYTKLGFQKVGRAVRKRRAERYPIGRINVVAETVFRTFGEIQGP